MTKKYSKGYTINVILMQMLLLPIVLTLLLFIIGPLLNAARGNYMAEFGNLTVAFAIPLLVGGLFGMLFSRMKVNKPASPVGRYLPLLIPALYALCFAVLAAVMSDGNYNSSYWGIYAWKTPSFLILNFLLAFSGFAFTMPIAEIAAYLGFALGMVLQEWLGKTSLRGAGAVRMKGLVALAAAVFVLAAGVENKEVLQRGIIELRYGKAGIGKELTEYDLTRKAPFFAGNGLASLEQEASLQFHSLEELPRLDGATAAYPVYAAFVEAVYKELGDYYARDQKMAERYGLFVMVEEYPYSIVRCSKTPQAYENLINGQTDIIFVAEPSQGHLEKIRAKQDEFVLTPMGSDAFVFFTNTQNPVSNLSVGQLQDIYAGRITNWREVGGDRARILAYQRPEDSGSQTVMLSRVMQGEAMQEPTTITYAGGMGQVISQVADYQNARNAIGYTFMYYSSSMIQNDRIKYLAVDGVAPRTETVRSKEYPFTVPFYAVTLKSNTNPNVAKLLEWITSEEGQSLVEKTGYVPVN